MASNKQKIKDAVTMLEDIDPLEMAKSDYTSQVITAKLEKPTRNQILIKEAYESKAREFRYSTEETLEKMAEERSFRDLKRFSTKLKGMKEELHSVVAALLSQTKTELIKYAQNWNRADKNLRKFRAENNLTRTAKMPQNKPLHYGIMIFIIFAESLANSQFFAAGSESGLIGGIIVAGLLSVINFLLAIYLGVNGVRNAVHVNGNKKFMGVVMVVVWIIITGAVNIAAAHYRMNIDIDPLTAARDAFLSLIAAPFNIPDLKAWMLTLFGGLANASFFLKEITHSDMYPGYVDEMIKVEEAKDIFEDACVGIYDHSNETITDYVSKAGAIDQEAMTTLSEYRSLLLNSKSTIQSYPDMTDQITGEYAVALEKYRNYIRDHQAQDEIPAYFNDEPKLKETGVALKYSPVEKDEKKLDSMRKNISDLRSTIIEIQQELQAQLGPITAKVRDFLDDITQNIFGRKVSNIIPDPVHVEATNLDLDTPRNPNGSAEKIAAGGDLAEDEKS